MNNNNKKSEELQDIIKKKWENTSLYRPIWALSAAFICAVVVFVMYPYTDVRERHIFDSIQGYYSTPAPKTPLVLILAGKRTMEEMTEWPNPRSTHAKLLEQLGSSRLVVFDVPFAGKTSPNEDDAIVRTVRDGGKAVGSSYVVPSYNGNVLQEPFFELKSAFRQVGVANVAPDIDSIYRKGIWAVNLSGRFLPSLPAIVISELTQRNYAMAGQGSDAKIKLPWKMLSLAPNSNGLVEFWINIPRRDNFQTYEYIDVLKGEVPSSAFNNAVVFIGVDGMIPQDRVQLSKMREVPHVKYLLYTVNSLLGDFSPYRTSNMQDALLTAVLVIVASYIGFSHLKKGLILLVVFFVVWISCVIFMFFASNIWTSITAPCLSCIFAFLGSQAIQSWRLYHEWSVRSLSLKPLLALAQRDDTELMNMQFDDYLRSLWKEIEAKTRVMLYSIRVNENVALVRRYLAMAQEQQAREGGERSDKDNFLIIRNASDMSPYHRMLLPLPFWKDYDRFNPREYVILAWDGNVPTETLTSLAALTLFAAVHFHALEEGRSRKDMFLQTIKAIMAAVEAKDQVTSDHSRRVAELSRKLAQWMKLKDQEVDDIYFSAIIHDIGKLAIPDNILKKPGKLTDDERDEIRKHAAIGAKIMREVDLSEYIISGIEQHHERYDGLGYPKGLKKDEITMAGKIIHVADVFDALVNQRQYKNAWTKESIRKFLEERRGTEFDPHVVDVFLRHLTEDSRNPLLVYGTLF